MKYQAFNNRIVVSQPNQQTSAGGIIFAASAEKPVVEVLVVATTELTEALQGKTICVERRHCSELEDDGEVKYASVKLEDIVAVKV